MGLHENKLDSASYRIHVCPRVGLLYVFPTVNMDWVTGKKAQTEYKGRVTSKGVLVKPADLDATTYSIPQAILKRVALASAGMGSSEKGRAAESIVAEMIRQGHLPFSRNVRIVTDRDEQISGIDLWAGEIPIQVKMDFNGGEKELGGTGNLYIETHSDNFLKEF